MDPWVWLIVAACALAIGEVVTTGLFFLAFFAVGAALAALVSAAGAPAAVVIAVFLVTSLAGVLFVRPVARRHLRMPAHLRTGTAALIGTDATVVERIAHADGVGCARFGWKVWTARAFDEDRVIEAGE